MNLEDFNDPDFEMGGPLPAMSDIPDRPLSQMFAEPLHVDGGGGASDFGGFDSNFDSDFGGFDSGFDNGFSGLDNDFGAMSTASLPPLNTIPSMGDSMGDGGFSSSGFGSRAAPPPSGQAPVFVGSNEGFMPGGNGKGAILCGCLYFLLIVLLGVILCLCGVITYHVIEIDEDLNHLKLTISVPTNAAPSALPPPTGLDY
mmetsp:Transcript_128222/g.191088  ORF Transcript_128222/g.191088 Transcript_128222/m.191088 type:complete len:200 (+) Transcript_128222:139-738(+)|eukprot:CAMPEP_0117044268 /NCGR_PEP_ID=MMETSP0472-20121206/30699_1 /TAXON_ID=693140 ORGANISM="Tiarina fusus, Strain LIS" /NCGR_SAMPLE_ID=MMETSP0472 /ASSEMBLY_ACC=CAM_ASM_000603 /LENGTH=199 /DNA_ID=CAMNT_0004755969 /DNA_START=139 /DNA_END=738 /DNA_ORIENTATION=+